MRAAPKCPHDSGIDPVAPPGSRRLSWNFEEQHHYRMYHPARRSASQVQKYRYFDNLNSAFWYRGQVRQKYQRRKPFFCACFTFWVHKYGTACAKVDWMVGEQCFMSEVFRHAVIQWFCKCLMKEPQKPEEQARLVERCRRSDSNFDAFHILTANVEDTVYIRLKERRQ